MIDSIETMIAEYIFAEEERKNTPVKETIEFWVGNDNLGHTIIGEGPDDVILMCTNDSKPKTFFQGNPHKFKPCADCWDGVQFYSDPANHPEYY